MFVTLGGIFNAIVHLVCKNAVSYKLQSNNRFEFLKLIKILTFIKSQLCPLVTTLGTFAFFASLTLMLQVPDLHHSLTPYYFPPW